MKTLFSQLAFLLLRGGVERTARLAAGCDCSVLDPRYPETRRFIIGAWVHAVRDWDLDGFKLDFIDRFETNGTFCDGMDCYSVEDAAE